MVIETKDGVGVINNVRFDNKAEQLINTKPKYWGGPLIVLFATAILCLAAIV